MSKLIPSINDVSAQDFYITNGLYEFHSFTMEDEGTVKRLVYMKSSVDCFCPGCGKHSVFTSQQLRTPHNTSYYEMIDAGHKDQHTVVKTFACNRDCSVTLTFSVLLIFGQIVKIGQFPSHADLTIPAPNASKRFCLAI